MKLLRMKSTIFFIGFMLFSSVFLTNCKKDEEEITTDNLFIDASLQPYFNRFVAAGAERGVTIDLAGKKIEGYIQNIPTDGVVGQCSYNSETGLNRKLTIDSNYWKQATDLEKEFVIFHELGHCYLERSHLDTSTRGTCSSIMHSGLGRCRFTYNQSSRTTYLDELFQ